MRRCLSIGILLVAMAAPVVADSITCDVYVDSVGGSDTSPYDTWAKASNDVVAAAAVATAGETICLDDGHTESTAATITILVTAGTHTQPFRFVSVDKADDSYSRGASIATSSANSDIVFDGVQRWKGVDFDTYDDYNLVYSSHESIEFDDCTFSHATNNANMYLSSTGVNAQVIMRNSTITFVGTNGRIGPNDRTIWEDVTVTGDVTGGGLFLWYADMIEFICRGCDFSALSGETFFDNSASSGRVIGNIIWINTTMPASYTLDDGGSTLPGLNIVFYGVDDTTGDDNFIQEYHGYQGSIFTDESVYMDTGLQFTEDSSRASLRFETASHVDTDFEALCSPIMSAEWINATGSKTFTTELVENYTTALDAAQVYQDVFYLGTSGSPLWSVDFGQSVGSDTALSAGTGLGNWTAEPSGSRSVKLTTTVTVNKAGLYGLRLCVSEYEAGKVVHWDARASIS